MLNLPENFKQNVINRYGEDGTNWLNKVNSILEKYIQKFNLSNVVLMDNLSMNILLSASSDTFGDLIIKMGAPSSTTISEMNYIKLCPNEYFAKCYYYDPQDKIMILEKLQPGYPLSNLETIEERIAVFHDLYTHINILNFPSEFFKSYDDMLKERTEFIKVNQIKDKSILHIASIANKLYSEIKDMHLLQYLLHNDLHHKNILKSKDEWKIIDPHGIIGEKVFEAIQFIRIELGYIPLDNIEELMTFISNDLEEDKILLYKALYITTFLKIIYYTKSKYDSSIIEYNINLCKKIEEVLN